MTLLQQSNNKINSSKT